MATKVRLRIGAALALATCIVVTLFIIIGQSCACSSLANESAAVGSLRALYSANVAYAKDHPDSGYSKSLNQLSSHSDESEQYNDDRVIDPIYSGGVKSGYKFSYSPRSSKGDGKFDAYDVFADPIKPGKSGERHFFMNETGLIHVSKTGVANVSDPILH